MPVNIICLLITLVNCTEGSVYLTPGFSHLEALTCSYTTTNNIFIHPITQTTTRISITKTHLSKPYTPKIVSNGLTVPFLSFT
jgi:hypothetical protein